MYNLLKTSFFLFIFLVSTNSNSQIIYEDGFPTEFHGIWSDNCAKPSEYAVRIDKYTSYEVTDYGTYLDIPKLRIVSDYLVVIYPGTKEYPDEWYNFIIIVIRIIRIIIIHIVNQRWLDIHSFMDGNKILSILPSSKYQSVHKPIKIAKYFILPPLSY